MTTAAHGKISGFNANVMRFLENVEYRRIDNADDLEDIARIRQKAFSMVGLAPQDGTMLIDDLDFKPNAHVLGIFFDEQLVSTIRVHHVTAAHPDSVAVSHFPDVMNPLLEAGQTFIDPVRFAADPEIVREYPALPYLTLRVATMATDYFKTDFCLSVIKPNHRAFYKRIFNSRPLVEPRYFEKYDSNIELHASNANVELQRIYDRFPFFNSQPFERKLMFAPRQDLMMPSLTVRPTARYALQSAAQHAV
ncbi:acetyltransferase [Hoeflea sp. G2-23]|uniref:Acetyltransferase n=1 Tax=Hoeflea algicola TaxID=2983763 RepID=A0ABT3ZAM3_9HYPH|nr:acetyltransferase [Hoeflea algicola]MCY0148384.1 acetyltransferase [Hoeflea algicola]